MAERTKNPRREILAELRTLAELTRTMIDVWHAPPSTRYFADEPGGHPGWHVTPRAHKDIPTSEYQENDPEQLRQLMRYMAGVGQLALKISLAADKRLAELKKNEEVPRAQAREMFDRWLADKLRQDEERS